MCSSCATCRALATSRDAIATTSDHAPFCMAGITFVVAIRAAPSTAHRTLSGILRVSQKSRRAQRALSAAQKVFGQRLMIRSELFGGAAQIGAELARPVSHESLLRDFGQRGAVVVEDGFAEDLAGTARRGPGGTREPEQVGRHVRHGGNSHD